MLNKTLKRVAAGVLSALTVLPSVPLAGADGLNDASAGAEYEFRSSIQNPYEIMPLAAEDDVASEAVINVGDKYVISDPSAKRATFLQNGGPRNVWPMYTKLSDNTTVRAYCGDHSKGDPGSSGMTFTVTERSSNMRLYGVVTQSDARNTRAAFINMRGNGVLTEANFNDWMYFCASQAAIWAAIGDAGIQAGSISGVTWESSESLGYSNNSGKWLSASNTEHALTLYAATQMLKYGIAFDQVWGPSGMNHAPYIGAAFTYSPGKTEFDTASKKIGNVNLSKGITNSGVFAEETIDGTPCLVLPMAAASATFVRGKTIEVRMENPPEGAFLVSGDGTKSSSDNGAQRLTLTKAENNNGLNDNANNMAYGETFKFCLPKETAEKMDQENERLNTSFTCVMNVDRYNVFIAKPPSSAVQPGILVEPAVQKISGSIAFSSEHTTEDRTSLRVMKTDKNGNPLPGCTFQISYTENGEQKIADATTDSSGQALFDKLPLNVAVTVTETSAPEGYELAEPQTVSSGTGPEKMVTVTFEDQDSKDFIIRKISSSDGRKLPDATFEIKCIDNGFSTTLTTGPMGEAVIHGKDMPVGSYEAYEIDAPEGYVLDGTVKTFEWDNTHDVTITFSDAPEASIEVFKYDGETKDPLKGATFEIRKESQVVNTVTTDANGKATISGLSKGYYQVVETNAPEGYLVDPIPHEVYIDPAADPTSIVRKVSISNSKKVGLRIVKIDKGTRVPLPGFTFQIFKDGALLTTETTDANGEILLEGLEPGTYRAHEQGGPDDYNIDAPDQEIEIVKDATEIPTMTFENSKKKGYWLLKIDKDTGRPIPNVTFELSRDGQTIGSYTTDETGYVKLENVEPGTYVARETAVPDHYIKSDEVFLVEIDETAEEPVIITITNTEKKELVFKKIDEDTGKPMPGVVFEIFLNNTSIGTRTTDENGEIRLPYADPGSYRFEERHTLAGYELNRKPINVEQTADRDIEVTVSNIQRKKLIFHKRDAQSKEPLVGVVFEIFLDGKSLGNYKTDENGEIVIQNAPPGSYTALEKSTLPEYILNEDVIEVEHTLAKDTHVYVDNIHRPGLGIRKLDSVTGQPIEGVRFHVWCSPKGTDGDMQDLGEHTTDKEGYILFDTTNGKYLDEGWYKVTEVEPAPGYIIKEPATQTIHIANNEYKEVTFYNQPKSGLVIWKYDSVTGKAVEGAVFQVRYLAGTSGTGGTIIGTYKTGPNGSVTVTNLKPGTYVVEEIACPDGYVINSAPQTVYISDDEQAVVEVHFGNAPDGDVLIKKIDAITKLPLAGVKFKVTTSDGTVVGNSNGEFITDEKGSILISGIEPDTSLIITEMETISGYVLDTTPKTIKTKAGEAVTVTFENQPDGTLIVEKYDSVTGKPLEGVQFKITTANGETLPDNEGLTSSNGLYKTNKDGQIVLTHLTPGSYVVTETKPLPGYSMDDAASQTVVVKTGDTHTIRFYNTPDGSLIIKKIDSITKEPLAGVKFEVKTVSGADFETKEYVTNEDGLITLTHLPTGTYSVVEKVALPGYELNDVAQTAHVEPGKTAELTFTNTPLGGLLIRKLDAVTKEPLGGVTIKITRPDGTVVGTSGGEFVTDESGYISLIDLEPGTYIAEEVKAKEGYVLDKTPKTIVIKDHQTYTLTFYNQPYGKLIVHKVDSVTKKPLEGVEFEIMTSTGELAGDYPLADSSTNAGGSPAGSATDVTGQVSFSGHYITDINGDIVINSVKPGTYVIREIKTIDGYIINTRPQTVVVGPNDTQTITIGNPPKGSLTIRKINSVTKEPLAGVEFKITTSGGDLVEGNEGATSTNGLYRTDENGEIVLGKLKPDTYVVTETATIPGFVMSAEPQTVRVDANDAQVLTFTNTPKGGLLIKKMDAVTKAPLADVVFKITKPNGAVVGTSNGEYRTDEYGYISLPDLQPGTYVVKEIAEKKGYVLDDTPKTITIEDHQTYTMEIFNQPEGGLVIRKIDSVTRDPLEGVQFQITTASGELVPTNEGLTSSNGLYTTDATGEIRLNKLTPGTYVVKETKTIAGYMMDATPQTVVVNEGDTQTLTFTNTPGGTLTVKKVDSVTKEPISGVEFEVKGYASTDYPGGTYTTDANGLFRLDGIPTGTYTVTETKAKDGYKLDNNSQTVQINAGESKELTFENEPLGGLVIKKMDASTKEPLSDVTFKVTTLDGTLVGTSNGEYRTDENGFIRINSLAPGGYIVQEVATKPGYLLDNTPKTIEIKDHQLYTLEFFNKPKGGLVIRKIDSNTREPLAGVEFKITTASGEFAATNEGLTSSNGIYVTDVNGEIVLNKLQPGTYIVTEQKTIDGYLLDAAPQTVVVSEGDTQTLTFTNTKKEGLVIRKIDEDTRKPLAHAIFSITKSSGEVINGRAETDINGLITLTGLDPGTYIISEVKAPDGYILQDAPQTVDVKTGAPTEVTFTNRQSYGIQIRKIVKGTHEPLGDCKFEVKKANGEFVGSYTTDSSGIANVSGLEDGVYVVQEVSAPEGYKINPEPQNVIVKAGQLATVTFENERLAGIRIKKIDAVTKEGIYGVRFLVKDEGNRVIGEYTTNQDGYIDLDDLVTNGESTVTFKVEEIAAAPGYVLDSQVKTLKVNRGETTELVVENTPILGQIQITKKAGQDNPVTNQPKGTALPGAVFEITNADTGRVVDTVTTDARGVAATNPIPLGRYFVQEIKAPAFYKINNQKVEVKLKVEGDVVQIEVYDDAANIKTSIQKTGNQTVDAGASMRYDFYNIANRSNTALDNFFWHDRVPTDAVRASSITTGTYNARVWYKINYKTNKNDYRLLADNLLSTNSYSFKIDSASLKLAADEYVTDFRYEFGTVPAGFRLTEKATLYVYVPAYMGNGYKIINRADAGGSYQGEWDSSTASWTTIIYRPTIPTPSIPKLPQTGY